MVIMEWIRKITDIIMPEPTEEEDEVKDSKKVESKIEVQESASEKKVEQSEPQVQQARQTETVQRQAAAGMGGMGKTFTRTSGTVSTADNGVTSMNGMRYEAYSSEASVRPSLAVVKTPQITMKIYTPLKYDEQVQSIGQDLIKHSAVLVNYEGVDDSAQQRIGDFVLGVVYTISGRVEMITSKIVLYVPEGFEIESAKAALSNMRRYN